jgi:lambda repressor-like predicted transcriptional regulator
MKTLHICPAVEVLGDCFPVTGTMRLNRLSQAIVLQTPAFHSSILVHDTLLTAVRSPIHHHEHMLQVCTQASGRAGSRVWPERFKTSRTRHNQSQAQNLHGESLIGESAPN